MFGDVRKLVNPRSLNTSRLTPENTAGVGPTKSPEMGKGVWENLEPITKVASRSIDASSTDVIIFETYIKQVRIKPSNPSM